MRSLLLLAFNPQQLFFPSFYFPPSFLLSLLSSFPIRLSSPFLFLVDSWMCCVGSESLASERQVLYSAGPVPALSGTSSLMPETPGSKGPIGPLLSGARLVKTGRSWFRHAPHSRNLSVLCNNFFIGHQLYFSVLCFSISIVQILISYLLTRAKRLEMFMSNY